MAHLKDIKVWLRGLLAVAAGAFLNTAYDAWKNPNDVQLSMAGLHHLCEIGLCGAVPV